MFENRSEKYVGITGVCGGIGKSLAKEFLKRGFNIIGLDIDEVALEEIRKEFGEKHFFYRCDVSKKAEMKETFKKIYSSHGPVQIWVNNAGIAKISPFLQTSEGDFDIVMKINWEAIITGTRYWLSQMEKEGEGVVVNIASMAGRVSPPFMASYVASKHAVVGFTKSIQAELDIASSKLKCVVVCPGFVDTPIMKVGEKWGFPEKLKFLASTPDSCAAEIVSGVLKGKVEISPTPNAKLLGAVDKFYPSLNKFGGRVWASKNWKQLLGIEKIDL